MRDNRIKKGELPGFECLHNVVIIIVNAYNESLPIAITAMESVDIRHKRGLIESDANLSMSLCDIPKKWGYKTFC